MATTRRAMQIIGTLRSDLELVGEVLAARSDAEAALAFTLLRGTLAEPHLVMLANLRGIVAEMPKTPFRTGQPLEILGRVSGYEYTGRSYRRAFESAHGVFGLEFLGDGNLCEAIVVHTPTSRFSMGAAPFGLDEVTLNVLVNHTILLDAVLEGLELLGHPLTPRIYMSADDFVSEHMAAAAFSEYGQIA